MASKSESSPKSGAENQQHDSKTPLDGRELPNPFSDYDGSNSIFDSEGKLVPEIATPIRQSIVKLLSVLDKRLLNEIKWSDSSVYTGTAGIALLYMHALDKREVYASDSEELRFSYTSALQYIERSLPYLKKKHYSFLCGCSGPLTTAALIHFKAGKKHQSDIMFQRVLNLEKEAYIEENTDELLFGHVGYLYSLLLIRQEIGKDEYADKIIAQGVDCVLKSGKRNAKRSKNKMNFPLYYEWHNKVYVGAAHGFAGILCILLSAREFVSSDDLNNFIKPSIDIIRSLQFPSGNFPSSLGNENDKLVHWCHGAPGVIHLMLLAYQVFQEQKYLESARKCSSLIWEKGLLKKGYGLCHGVAGNGYAHLRVYQVTKEKKYLYRALQFAKFCTSYGKHDVRTPDHPYSLMEGMAGTIYFLIDILNPETAAFPAFQLK